MLDRYLWGTASRLSPEAAVPVVDFVEQSQCLGGAGNVAANIAALGGRVEMFGVVGAGKSASREVGESLRKDLRAAGDISDKGVIADPRRITSVRTRIMPRAISTLLWRGRRAPPTLSILTRRGVCFARCRRR